MSTSTKKKDVFTKIGSYVAFSQRTKTKADETTNLYPSVNNKKDIVPFMLDILKTVAGTEALKDLIGKLFTDFVDDAEPQLKDALKKQTIQYNAGDELPTYFKSGGTGVTVPAKGIDVNNDTENDLLRDSSKPGFNDQLRDAYANPGTEVVGATTIIKYNASTDMLTFKENPALGTTIGGWVTAFIDDIAIINKKEFLTKVMDNVYGSVTASQGKSVEQVYEELQVKKQIAQLIDDNDSFEITQDEYDALLQQAQALVDGVIYYDMGCGIIAASLPLSGMTNLIMQISGSTDSNFVGNAVAGTVDESTSDDNAETTTENKATIKDGFFQRLIKAITEELAFAITTAPQIRALLAITSAFQNNGIAKTGNPKDDQKNFKVLLNCLVKDVMKMINEFIFNLVVSYLIALLTPIIKKVIQEKINQFINILKSLVL